VCKSRRISACRKQKLNLFVIAVAAIYVFATVGSFQFAWAEPQVKKPLGDCVVANTENEIRTLLADLAGIRDEVLHLSGTHRLSLDTDVPYYRGVIKSNLIPSSFRFDPAFDPYTIGTVKLPKSVIGNDATLDAYLKGLGVQIKFPESYNLEGLPTKIEVNVDLTKSAEERLNEFLPKLEKYYRKLGYGFPKGALKPKARSFKGGLSVEQAYEVEGTIYKDGKAHHVRDIVKVRRAVPEVSSKYPQGKPHLTAPLAHRDLVKPKLLSQIDISFNGKPYIEVTEYKVYDTENLVFASNFAGGQFVSINGKITEVPARTAEELWQDLMTVKSPKISEERKNEIRKVWARMSFNSEIDVHEHLVRLAGIARRLHGEGAELDLAFGTRHISNHVDLLETPGEPIAYLPFDLQHGVNVKWSYSQKHKQWMWCWFDP